MIDEDREGGFSEPETQVIEYLTWRLDIYPDYPQEQYLEEYQRNFEDGGCAPDYTALCTEAFRPNWPEMFVTAPDGKTKEDTKFLETLMTISTECRAPSHILLN